jgi:hypothetical protein
MGHWHWLCSDARGGFEWVTSVGSSHLGNIETAPDPVRFIAETRLLAGAVPVRRASLRVRARARGPRLYGRSVLIMLRLRLAASLAAGALLSCAGLVQAAEPQQQFNSPSNSTLSLDRPPLYLAQQKAADTSLMGLADRSGFGKVLTENGLSIGGWVQGGWTYNFDDPAFDINVGRVFDFENQDPTLHQIVFFVDKSVDSKKFDIGGRMEWMWGSDARLIHSNGLFDHYGVNDGPDEQFDLTQLYADVNVPVGSGLKLRVGKFVTTIGYEYINPNSNALYSHSFLFGFAIPFTHTGIVGFYNLNDQFQLIGGVTRGWEQSLEDNNDEIDGLWGVVWTLSKNTSLAINGTIGPERAGNNDDMRYLFDVILSHKIGDNLTIAVNGDYGWEESGGADGDDGQWYGIAGYASFTITDLFAVNGRIEYFNDDDGARGLGTGVFEATLGLDIKPLAKERNFSTLRIRPEVRWDASDDKIFDGFTEDNQFTFGVDVIFGF